MYSKTGCLVAILFCLLLPSSAFGSEYSDVTPDTRLKFPRDFYYRDNYRVQWWYLTGHLYDETGREFGYQLTFFVVNVQKRKYQSRFGVNRIYISHFALSDAAVKKFHFSEEADTGVFGYAGAETDRLKVWTGRNVLEGTPKSMRISAVDGENGLDLRLVPAKDLVLHGDRGYSRKSEESPLIASLYFSYPDLKTEGTLTAGGKTYRVKGRSWFDREISSRGLGEGRGWDWFSIRLGDGREIMLYLVRRKDGSADKYSSGTFIYPDGRYRHLLKEEFAIHVLSHYKSSGTGSRYPSEWEVSIPSERVKIRVKPLFRDQEVVAHGSTGNHYWEGACSVVGTAKGRAYVEMTGY